MSRESLYVGLTRGRHANHAYVALETSGSENHVAGDEPTGRQILETVLRSPASETSASSALKRGGLSYVGILAARSSSTSTGLPTSSPSTAAVRQNRATATN